MDKPTRINETILRDVIAIVAMNGLITRDTSWPIRFETVARHAYEMADVMLKARSEPRDND